MTLFLPKAREKNTGFHKPMLPGPRTSVAWKFGFIHFSQKTKSRRNRCSLNSLLVEFLRTGNNKVSLSKGYAALVFEAMIGQKDQSMLADTLPRDWHIASYACWHWDGSKGDEEFWKRRRWAEHRLSTAHGAVVEWLLDFWIIGHWA
jgi:hypothetical protein